MSSRFGAGCMTGWCVILAVIILRGNGASGGGVIGALEMVPAVIKGIANIWSEIAPDGVVHPLQRNEEHELMEKMTEVMRQLNRLEEQETESLAAIHNLQREMSNVPKLVTLANNLKTLENLMDRVDIQDMELTRYIVRGYDNTTEEATWRLERQTLEDFVSNVVSHSPSSVRGLLERIHSIVAPGKRRKSRLMGEGIMQQLAEATRESRSNMCNLQQSPQQLLYDLYNSVAITELKGYAMIEFSWMLLQLYKKGNFTVEAQLMQERYEERTTQKVDAVKDAMRVADRDMWRCDPRTHDEDETFVKLTQLLQGHVQNEVDMNTDSTCRETCGYYEYAKSHGCYDPNFCSKQQRCNGKLIDCQFIDSDMWVCASNNRHRRYDWIEYENGRILGKKGSCQSRTKVDSWWRWIFWHCSYCFCLCDEQGPYSDRYFNLREVKADTANNKVVTGLRFVKKNRVIHLQIQEAGLLPRGEINMTSVQWRPVDNYRISDQDVINGKDYHTLSWEQRAIDLDDLVAPAGSVLTGIRFRRVGTHLNLEIMVTPLNFTTGTLDKPHQKSIWHGNDNTDASLNQPRKRLPIFNPDVPTLTSEESIVDSKNDQFLLFTHSDMSKDAAQTTVPYLDAQPVAPDPPTLLAGAGIYHKGRNGYGGFIGPKVVTYDYSAHIEARFPVTEDLVN